MIRLRKVKRGSEKIMYNIDDLKKYIYPRINNSCFVMLTMLVGQAALIIYQWIDKGMSFIWPEKTMGHIILIVIFVALEILFAYGLISEVKRVFADRRMLKQWEQNGLLEKMVIDFKQATSFVSDKLRIGNNNIFVKHNITIYPINKINKIYIDESGGKGPHFKLHLELENGIREDLGLEWWDGRRLKSEVIKVAEELRSQKENIKVVLVDGSEEREIETKGKLKT